MMRSVRPVILGLLAVIVSFAAAQAPSRATVLSPQEPATLMPHFDLLTLTHEVQNLVFDCLYTIGADGDYRPQLATEVPTLANGGISEDGTTYTVRLRDDVRWHDGEPFTSADVRYTWQVITDPDLPVPSRAVWEDITEIETPDPHTAVVHFGDTNVAFLGAASSDACFMMPEHRLAGADLTAGPFNRAPVGTGPFTLAEWESGAFARLEAHQDYFAGAPELDEIVVRFATGSGATRTALQRGEAELALHIGAADLSFAQRLDGYEVAQAPDHAWWQFWIDNQDPILSDVRVRRALAHGLDKQLITDTVFAGVVEPQHAIFPRSHWAHADDVRRYAYDPDAARALLEEAGWTHDAPGEIRTRDGEPLRIEILNIAGQADRRQVVQIAQDLWRDVGIDARIREIDGASFPPTMGAGDFQLAYGWFGESQEPVFSLWLGTNWQNYANEEALDLLREVSGLVDREDRAENIREFQRTVAEEAVMLPLAPRPLLNVVSDRLEGVDPTLSGSLWNAHRWTLR
ncbi:MAG: peptide ABC transporter substrate-binding protein [Trueperaceae bacterium]|nr:peptide ABC transporter substrate-binding protein [Trueperaceae bacterium]